MQTSGHQNHVKSLFKNERIKWLNALLISLRSAFKPWQGKSIQVKSKKQHAGVTDGKKKLPTAVSNDKGVPLLQEQISAPCGDKTIRFNISTESLRTRDV